MAYYGFEKDRNTLVPQNIMELNVKSVIFF